MTEAKRQKKPRRWKGELARKIRPQIVRPQGLAVTNSKTVARANQQMVDCYQRAIEKERNKKLRLLAKQYGITAGDYRSLALKLADEIGIPGFQVEHTLFEVDGYPGGLVDRVTREGRPTEWSVERLLALLGAVKQAKDEHDFIQDREALKYLDAQGKEWAPPSKHRGDWVKTLQNRLGEAKKIEYLIDDCRKIIEELSRENPGN
jgi:hypothetical protein